MKRRILYAIIGGAIFLIIGLVFGLITGAYIGGNYFTGFEFDWVRGYEAVGIIGAMLVATFGALVGTG